MAPERKCNIEKGVAIHLLYLVVTDFGARDVNKSGVQAALWGQYVLDNAESVSEALALLESIQPVMVTHQGIKATVHLAIGEVPRATAQSSSTLRASPLSPGREGTVL